MKSPRLNKFQYMWSGSTTRKPPLENDITEADFERWRQCLIVEIAADALFPDGHADLSLDLIQSIISAFGDDGMYRLLEIRAAR